MSGRSDTKRKAFRISICMYKYCKIAFNAKIFGVALTIFTYRHNDMPSKSMIVPIYNQFWWRWLCWISLALMCESYYGHIMHMNSYLVIPDSIARYFKHLFMNHCYHDIWICIFNCTILQWYCFLSVLVCVCVLCVHKSW